MVPWWAPCLSAVKLVSYYIRANLLISYLLGPSAQWWCCHCHQGTGGGQSECGPWNQLTKFCYAYSKSSAIICLAGSGCRAAAFLWNFRNMSAGVKWHRTNSKYLQWLTFVLQFLLRPPWNWCDFLTGLVQTDLEAWPRMMGGGISDAFCSLLSGKVSSNSLTWCLREPLSLLCKHWLECWPLGLLFKTYLCHLCRCVALQVWHSHIQHE